VEAGPQNLMTKLIITALKLCIWDPDRATRMHVPHPAVDVSPEVGTKVICGVAEGANPELVSHAVLDAVDGILEPSIAMTVRCKIIGFDVGVKGVGTGIPRS